MAIEEVTDAQTRGGSAYFVSRFLPGIALSVVVAFAGYLASVAFSGPAPLYAMILGLLVSPLARHGNFGLGFDLCTGFLLKLAIVLLGVRISFGEVLEIGIVPLILIASSIGLGLALSSFIARRIGLGIEFGLIAGAAVSICGVSAALAAASLFSQTSALKRDTLFVALSVTLLSTLAMIFYPLITNWLQFGDARAGMFLGATIHDLAQVVGAGYGISATAGDTAVLTKLVRVGLLAPAIGAAALIARSDHSNELKLEFPWFIALFGIAMLWHTAGLIPVFLLELSNSFSTFLLLAAISAIALKTNWKGVLSGNWKRFGLVAFHTVALACAAAIIFSIAE